MLNLQLGDATKPIGEGLKIICHICNDKNKWGRGFVLALSAKWNEPEEAYRRWTRGKDLPRNATPFKLGNVQIIKVTPDIRVANMIAQHDIRFRNGVPPIRYDALRICLRKVAKYAKDKNASIHLPYLMGAGLAGGDWNKIEEIIREEMSDVSVTIYNFLP